MPQCTNYTHQCLGSQSLMTYNVKKMVSYLCVRVLNRSDIVTPEWGLMCLFILLQITCISFNMCEWNFQQNVCFSSSEWTACLTSVPYQRFEESAKFTAKLDSSKLSHGFLFWNKIMPFLQQTASSLWIPSPWDMAIFLESGCKNYLTPTKKNHGHVAFVLNHCAHRRYACRTQTITSHSGSRYMTFRSGIWNIFRPSGPSWRVSETFFWKLEFKFPQYLFFLLFIIRVRSWFVLFFLLS